MKHFFLFYGWEVRGNGTMNRAASFELESFWGIKVILTHKLTE